MRSETGGIPDEARDFQWRVPFRGFRWTPKETSASGRHLIPAGEWVEWRSTWPLKDEPTLFCLFSQLETNETQILEFANEHGLLRSNEELRPAGSTIMDWAARISGMRMAIRLHEAARAHDPQGLGGLLKVENGAVVIVEPQLIGRLPGLGSFWELSQQPSDLDEPRLLLWGAKTVVKNIADSCLFWSGLRPEFDNPSSDAFSLSRAPTNLISALWLQFSYSTRGRPRSATG